MPDIGEEQGEAILQNLSVERCITSLYFVNSKTLLLALVIAAFFFCMPLREILTKNVGRGVCWLDIVTGTT